MGVHDGDTCLPQGFHSQQCLGQLNCLILDKHFILDQFYIHRKIAKVVQRVPVSSSSSVPC